MYCPVRGTGYVYVIAIQSLLSEILEAIEDYCEWGGRLSQQKYEKSHLISGSKWI